MAIYIRSIISVLVSSTKELVIDATFATNSSEKIFSIFRTLINLILSYEHVWLCAVLTELDGTGISLCYLFSGVCIASQVSKPEDSGSTTLLLEKSPQPLKAVGFDPIFFDNNKDRAKTLSLK